MCLDNCWEMLKLDQRSKTNDLKQGKQFGYPNCCVTYFANRDDLAKINKLRSQQLGSIYNLFLTMYCVPCPKCYNILLRNKEDTLKMFKITDLFTGVRYKDVQ